MPGRRAMTKANAPRMTGKSLGRPEGVSGEDTRARLLEIAASLFAEQGYRGASVRTICDLAAANPGAVSYHFGGKRQLYRAVLRHAAEALAGTDSGADGGAGVSPGQQTSESRWQGTIRDLLQRVRDNQVASRLLLHDLADGGSVAVEALVPTLRGAYAALREDLTTETDAVGEQAAQLRFLQLAAPLFLLTAAWPVIERTLDLDPSQRDPLLAELLAAVPASPRW